MVRMRGDCLIGLGLAADIGTLVTVTHHAGSWTNGTFYAHHNHRGDIVLTRSGATTVGRYDYAAFGSLRSQTGPDVCRFTFSSKEYESSCYFYSYGRRFYSPQTQRWIRRDPISESGGLNLYTFVGNDAVNNIDALGKHVIRGWGPVRWWRILKCIKKMKCWAEECMKNIPNCDGVEGDIWEYIACLDRRKEAIKMCMETSREMIEQCQKGVNPVPPVKFPWESLFRRK